MGCTTGDQAGHVTIVPAVYQLDGPLLISHQFSHREPIGQHLEPAVIPTLSLVQCV